MVTTRLCECGCAAPLRGSHRRRFASDACRKRASRASPNGHHADTATAVADLPDVTPGRCRAGLEGWLRDAYEPPAVLVEAARSLADECDRQPQHSPLWGRYLDCLRQLVEVVGAHEDRAAADLLFELNTRCESPGSHRIFGVHCARCCEGTS